MGQGNKVTESHHILVVDDEPDIRDLIVETLTPAHQVTAASTPQQAIECCRRQCFHLALVDVRLPGLSGMELAPRLRGINPRMGFVLITAYPQVGDAVEAVRRLGALNYVGKPFSPADLVHLVGEALVELDRNRLVQVGDLVIDCAARRVSRDGQPLRLSGIEFELLLYLACRRGQVVSYGELLSQVWGYEPSLCQPEIVRNAISHLRTKLAGGAEKPGYILTVRGAGYQAIG